MKTEDILEHIDKALEEQEVLKKLYYPVGGILEEENMESVLHISKIGFPVWSLRECRQKLFPIKTAALRRTINGVLISVIPKTHQKYGTIISCQDKNTPAMEHLWIGEAVRVFCIQPLVQEFENDEIYLSRPAVQNSIFVYDHSHNLLPFHQEGEKIKLEEKVKGYVHYRPILEMRLKSFEVENEEWALKTSWQMELEEI